MRIEELRAEPKYRTSQLVISCPPPEILNIINLIDEAGEIDKDAEYDVKITKRRKKRSLDANGYLWVLIGELSRRLKMANSEVYRRLLYDYGYYIVIGAQKLKYDDIRRAWESRGEGWFLEELGESKKNEGILNVRAYCGSSVYDTAQMSRLIDGCVAECKENGIETMTPAEIAELKSNWRYKDE